MKLAFSIACPAPNPAGRDGLECQPFATLRSNPEL
jgi:hypothetical protein